MNTNYRLHSNRGFSLIEIVISLLVLSGSIVVIFSGFDTSEKLNNYSAFESYATFLAERELEIFKSDLLSKKRDNFPGNAESRFQQKPGWKVNTIWTIPDKTQVVRIISSVSHSGQVLKLESFLYLPKNGDKRAL